jgi:predicted ATP-grasp superfamily ATP-dependent carboligase
VALCGSQLEVGSHVCFVKEHVAWQGPPEDVLVVYLVEAGVKLCKVGFLSQHLAVCADRYNGLIARVTKKYSSDYRVCDSTAKRQKYYCNLGVCRATIIGMHNLFV